MELNVWKLLNFYASNVELSFNPEEYKSIFCYFSYYLTIWRTSKIHTFVLSCWIWWSYSIVYKEEGQALYFNHMHLRVKYVGFVKVAVVKYEGINCLFQCLPYSIFFNRKAFLSIFSYWLQKSLSEIIKIHIEVFITWKCLPTYCIKSII